MADIHHISIVTYKLHRTKPIEENTDGVAIAVTIEWSVQAKS